MTFPTVSAPPGATPPATGPALHPWRELAGVGLLEATQRPIAPAPRVPDDIPELTERELQVLRGMSRGLSNGQIGRELYLSEDTVKTHARRLFRKIGVNDRAQAVALGFRWGLVR